MTAPCAHDGTALRSTVHFGGPWGALRVQGRARPHSPPERRLQQFKHSTTRTQHAGQKACARCGSVVQRSQAHKTEWALLSVFNSVAIGTSGNGGNTGTTERSTAFRDENPPDVRAVLACDGSGVHLLEGLVVGLSVGAALAHEPEPEPGLPAVTKDTLAQAYSARAPIRDSLMRSRGGPAGWQGIRRGSRRARALDRCASRRAGERNAPAVCHSGRSSFETFNAVKSSLKQLC